MKSQVASPPDYLAFLRAGRVHCLQSPEPDTRCHKCQRPAFMHAFHRLPTEPAWLFRGMRYLTTDGHRLHLCTDECLDLPPGAEVMPLAESIVNVLVRFGQEPPGITVTVGRDGLRDALPKKLSEIPQRVVILEAYLTGDFRWTVTLLDNGPNSVPAAILLERAGPGVGIAMVQAQYLADVLLAASAELTIAVPENHLDPVAFTSAGIRAIVAPMRF